MKNLSRRSFLKGSLAGALSLGAMSAMGMTAAAEESAIQWDAEYDVVVMGMGFAGTVAAITAADKGVKVLLVDRAPRAATPRSPVRPFRPPTTARPCTPTCVS